MRRRIVIPLICAIGLAAGPLGHAGASSPGKKAKNVLYQANWKHGSGGWNLAAGMKIQKGKLVMSGSIPSGSQPALAPFRNTGNSYAIVAKLKVGQPTNANAFTYGLDTRATSGNGLEFLNEHDAQNNYTGGSLDMTRIGYWNGNTAGWVPGDSATPAGMTGSTHTFRVEVQGSNYRMLIDGQPSVGWTALSEGASNGLSGISTSGIPVTVTMFKILRLKPQSITPVNNPDTFATHALTAADTGASSDGRFFEDNWWIAHLFNTSATTVAQSGLLNALVQNLWWHDGTGIWQTLYQFDTPANAQTDYQGQVKYFANPANAHPGFQPLNTAGLGIGEESFGFIGQTQSNGTTLYEEVIWFHRGDYSTQIDVTAFSQAALQQRTQAAFAAADGHMKS